MTRSDHGSSPPPSFSHPAGDTSPSSQAEGQTIVQALQQVRHTMAQAAQACHRNPQEIDLLAVSKFHPASAIEAAILAGQSLFGENRVQEAAEKFPPLQERFPHIELHLIGSLQTNKVMEAVKIAHTIQSLDRTKLADHIARAAETHKRLPHLLVQVNTGREPQKSGILPEQADVFIPLMQKRFGQALQGVMAIPPENQDPIPHFRLLRYIAHNHALPILSMGMSHDYQLAIAEGATMIRVGTAIFGVRQPL
ncbi:YggS family pyridoxal phosphate-dependent enzyme [Entomobacter blattae]|uniref:Pyridoxal phosphate homeostasis protein n=1 Tax=Entomobacter blattae TaxID=2762277 RepID=A0A7H1NQQ6_9PROT|nr:YggS family pyridoxal phosphate-dependent enzyme [Entomobacter blattae]QNT78116.1 Pyridoxal phosphate homeostasis protein [Entomobacter blattae]